MICPRCQASLDVVRKPDACPQCGTRLWRNVSGVIKTSAVLISADGEDLFFESVGDVPENLRRRMVESTSGENAGIIVIADRGGKEQIARDVARRQAARKASGGVSPDILDVAPEAAARSLPAIDFSYAASALSTASTRLHWLALAGVGVVLVGAAAFWILFSKG